MRRREFIAALGSAAACPLVAQAQQGDRVRRIGVLMNAAATDTEFQSYFAAFVQGLRQLGWTEGLNLRIDVRWNAGSAALAQTYAAQLIGLMPDVILASSSVNLMATQRASGTMPVVFVGVADPVGQGFVASVRQPGGSLTGFSNIEFSHSSSTSRPPKPSASPSTPMRRIRSPCCARATTGHAAALLSAHAGPAIAHC